MKRERKSRDKAVRLWQTSIGVACAVGNGGDRDENEDDHVEDRGREG